MNAVVDSPATVKINQIYFDQAQLPCLDPVFEPYDNCSNPHPELREFYVFNTAFKQADYQQHNISGFFSWKFQQKTGVSGNKFVSFVTSNPGYDVYFINPMVHDLQYKNVWTQAEKYHPGIIALTEKILAVVGYDVKLSELKMGFKTTLYCNFWAGAGKFWQQYLPFLQQCYDTINTKLSDSDRELLFTRADKNIDASYFPFIFERLFSTFLCLHPEIKACPYKYDAVDYKNLIGCDTSKRPWLLKCAKVLHSVWLHFKKVNF